MINRRFLVRLPVALVVMAAAPSFLELAPARAGDAGIAIADPGHVAWQSAAAAHGLDPLILYAIGVHESGRGDPEHRLRPWPYAINTPRGPVYAADADAARRVLASWGHDGRLDVGPMQVNLGFHRGRVASAAALLDPATNIRIAARILAEAIAAEDGDVWAGVGRYHSADPRRAQRYVAAVSETFRRVKAAQDDAAAASVPPLLRDGARR
ncbi:MAG: lytic transglycosylase domain-containing protein [Alphaproteobacteria bacterium]|nr:lytic transglycosylase domain-containing protein [Alphaproteobacteria bacterium]